MFNFGLISLLKIGVRTLLIIMEGIAPWEHDDRVFEIILGVLLPEWMKVSPYHFQASIMLAKELLIGNKTCKQQRRKNIKNSLQL